MMGSFVIGFVATGHVYANKQDGHTHEQCPSKSKEKAVKQMPDCVL